MKNNIEELRKIDAWIAEHVMGWQWIQEGDYYKLKKPEDKYHGFPEYLVPDGANKSTVLVKSYTTDPAGSDALDDKILEKCGYNIIKTKDGFLMWPFDSAIKIQAEHPDKKICRVLFAQKLFTK